MNALKELAFIIIVAVGVGCIANWITLRIRRRRAMKLFKRDYLP